jgi:flagellar hook-associated protein 1 FlgK
VADAVNAAVTATSGGPAWLAATVEDGRLKLTPDADHMFAFGGDDTNFLQVAGLNTFFTGHDASDIAVSADVSADLSRIAAGTVTADGEIFHGDNSNAVQVADIETDENVRFTGGSPSTLNDFYNSLVAAIGSDSRIVKRDYDYNTLVQDQLAALRDDTSGVSLDEEMANLIMFQQAYNAAAKLITTSDDMLQSLLDSLRR